MKLEDVKIGDRVIHTDVLEISPERKGLKGTVSYSSGSQVYVLFDGQDNPLGNYADNLEKEDNTMLKEKDQVWLMDNGEKRMSGTLLFHYTNTNFWAVEQENGKKVAWNVRNIVKKENKAMEFKLPNGAVLTGTPEQVISTAKMLGYSVDDSLFYNSSTHGRVLIKEMSTHHLKNALLKMYRDWAASLSGLSEKDLVLALRNGCTDKTFINLLAEYVTRIK